MKQGPSCSRETDGQRGRRRGGEGTKGFQTNNFKQRNAKTSVCPDGERTEGKKTLQTYFHNFIKGSYNRQLQTERRGS